MVTKTEKHPVFGALEALDKNPAWLAREARPDDPKQLAVRISDVANGRRSSFSKRDALAIWQALAPHARKLGLELTFEQVLLGRAAPRKVRRAS